MRVEVRGRVDGRAEVRIVGTAAPPAVVAAAVSATAARWAAAGRLSGPGAAGLAQMVDEPGTFLKEVAVAGGLGLSAFHGGEV